MFQSRVLLPTILLALLLSACAGTAPRATQPEIRPAPVLLVTPLAGQKIILLPLTWIEIVGSVKGVPEAHQARLRWADSLIGNELERRGPEVSWIRGEELRRVASRAPGQINDPAKLGQAIFRTPSLKAAPDQFLINLRPLATMTSSRYVLVPAAVSLTSVQGEVSARATLLLIDVRSGSILWRSEPEALASSPGAALTALFPLILP